MKGLSRQSKENDLRNACLLLPALLSHQAPEMSKILTPAGEQVGELPSGAEVIQQAIGIAVQVRVQYDAMLAAGERLRKEKK